MRKIAMKRNIQQTNNNCPDIKNCFSKILKQGI